MRISDWSSDVCSSDLSSKTLPTIIVIFGITGDLAQRKLLPALYHLIKENLLNPQTLIVGVTRQPVTKKELLDNVELCVNEVDKIGRASGRERVGQYV